MLFSVVPYSKIDIFAYITFAVWVIVIKYYFIFKYTTKLLSKIFVSVNKAIISSNFTINLPALTLKTFFISDKHETMLQNELSLMLHTNVVY